MNAEQKTEDGKTDSELYDFLQTVSDNTLPPKNTWKWFLDLLRSPTEELFAACPLSIIKGLSAFEWCILLTEHTDFYFEHCRFDIFDSHAWTTTVTRLGDDPRIKPLFSQWITTATNVIDSNGWTAILTTRPEYVEFCNVTDLPYSCVERIAEAQPCLTYIKLLMI